MKTADEATFGRLQSRSDSKQRETIRRPLHACVEGEDPFIHRLATMFCLQLKLIIGSITTSAAITVGGLALMVLPSLVVGNELLILLGVGAAVGVWFFAHRHGQLRGLVDAAKAAVDTPEKPV